MLAGAALCLAACQHGVGPKAESRVTAAGAPTPLRTLEIAHHDHWSREHFMEMAPTVRMSVPSGGDAVTRVYLRVPEGAVVTVTAPGSRSLVFPAGTESDRVSYLRGVRGTESFIDDVRGTRWDERGVEYFHVYKPRDASANAELDGVEWRRDDPDEERRATEWLVAYGRTHRSPSDDRPMDEDDVDRFRALNHCQSCHVKDKPEAKTDDDSLPPWPTDATGLYTPLAVLTAHAVLSMSSTFDDPNVDDPFVHVRCTRGTARVRGRTGDHWFACNDGVAIGERDLGAAMRAGDDYAACTCRARRYLFAHMDAASRAVFEPSVRVCPETADGR